MGASWLVCAMAGVVLDQAALGFATTWRAFIADRRGEGLSAQGEAFGTWLEGFVQPAGISMAVGAFICGVAMQLGGGCASGTLPPWLVA